MEIISLWRFKDTVLSTTQSPWPLRVAARIAARCVACLGNIRDIACGKRLASDDSDSNASHELIVNRP